VDDGFPIEGMHLELHNAQLPQLSEMLRFHGELFARYILKNFQTEFIGYIVDGSDGDGRTDKFDYFLQTMDCLVIEDSFVLIEGGAVELRAYQHIPWLVQQFKHSWSNECEQKNKQFHDPNNQLHRTPQSGRASSCRSNIIAPRLRCRWIEALGLRSVRVEVISFVAKSVHASSPNNLAGMQSETRSRFEALQSGSCGKHVQSSGFASLKIHAGIWLQHINKADNAVRGSML
jgi:hypothetical protein